MHNVWVRLNAVVFFALTVLMCMAVLAAFSSYLHTGEPVIESLRVNELKLLRNFRGRDNAEVYLDIHADLRPAWHWNLKQLFVYVVAEYESDINPLNQIVIWDTIIEDRELAVLNLERLEGKYSLIGQGLELRNKTVQLKLHWDHMPYTGRIYPGMGLGSTYTFPGSYQTTVDRSKDKKSSKTAKPKTSSKSKSKSKRSTRAEL
jgi:signal peptidase complex subunit 3